MKKLIMSNSDTDFFTGPKEVVDEINVNLIHFKTQTTQSTNKSIAKKLTMTKRMISKD